MNFSSPYYSRSILINSDKNGHFLPIYVCTDSLPNADTKTARFFVAIKYILIYSFFKINPHKHVFMDWSLYYLHVTAERKESSREWMGNLIRSVFEMSRCFKATAVMNKISIMKIYINIYSSRWGKHGDDRWHETNHHHAQRRRTRSSASQGRRQKREQYRSPVIIYASLKR